MNLQHAHCCHQQNWRCSCGAIGLLDSRTTGYSKWESITDRARAGAIDLIPKDIVICDWHYSQPQRLSFRTVPPAKGLFASGPSGFRAARRLPKRFQRDYNFENSAAAKPRGVGRLISAPTWSMGKPETVRRLATGPWKSSRIGKGGYKPKSSHHANLLSLIFFLHFAPLPRLTNAPMKRNRFPAPPADRAQ